VKKIFVAFFVLNLGLPGVTNQAFCEEFLPGDIILQPLRCRVCELIEAQEKTSFAHIGLVVSRGENPLVLEAWGSVVVKPLQQFLSKADQTRPHVVRRMKKSLFSLNDKLEQKILNSALQLVGLPYDRDFLWANVDSSGKELLYCSELITKLMAQFTPYIVKPKPMTFDIFFEEWERYFQGRVPQGELGNSPGDYERSDLYETVGLSQNGHWTWK
jgi:hypothetical protein